MFMCVFLYEYLCAMGLQEPPETRSIQALELDFQAVGKYWDPKQGLLEEWQVFFTPIVKNITIGVISYITIGVNITISSLQIEKSESYVYHCFYCIRGDNWQK